MTSRAEYVRAADIARLTGVSIRTARRWIADEIIPSVKLGGSRLVARAELERVLCPAFDVAEDAHENEIRRGFNVKSPYRENSQ